MNAGLEIVNAEIIKFATEHSWPPEYIAFASSMARTAYYQAIPPMTSDHAEEICKGLVTTYSASPDFDARMNAAAIRRIMEDHNETIGRLELCEHRLDGIAAALRSRPEEGD